MTLDQFIQTIQDITIETSLIKDNQELSEQYRKERIQALEQKLIDIINEYTRQHPHAMRILASFRGR